MNKRSAEEGHETPKGCTGLILRLGTLPITNATISKIILNDLKPTLIPPAALLLG
jgi:hypothetical protein